MKLGTAGWTVVLALGLGEPVAASGPEESWNLLTSLVGRWEGTYEGQPARVSYTLVSNGTAVMETLDSAHDDQMVTLYHRDGASLLLTHYCSMDNQSRMRAKGSERGRIEFTYVDATNLKSPDDHRMTHLVLTLRDPDHLVQEWTSKAGAQETVGRFVFRRVGK